VVREALLAALVLVTGTPERGLECLARACRRAVQTSIAVTAAANDERLAAPVAIQLPPVQRQSSLRKLGTGSAIRQTPAVAALTAPMEDPAPPIK
jgi:hypothetical protein